MCRSLMIVALAWLATLAAPLASAQQLGGTLYYANSPSSQGSDFSIWAVDLAQGTSRRVVDLTGLVRWVNELDVSPDGRRLLLSTWDVGAGANVWMVNSDGSGLERVTNYGGPSGAGSPRWAPVSPETLYYLWSPGTTAPTDHVRRLDLTDGTETPLYPTPGNWTKGMDITNDEADAVFVREYGCCWHPNSFVAAEKLDGSSYVILRNSNGLSDLCPRVNRTDGRIAYLEETRKYPDYSDVFVMDENGQYRIAVTGEPRPNNAYGCPIWAGEDHAWVVFGTTYFGSSEIVAVLPGMSAWPHEVRHLTTTTGLNTAPIWTKQTGNEAPDCSAARVVSDTLWPPRHALTAVTIAGVTDPDGDVVDVRAISVRQDEPTEGLGDGDSGPDAVLSPLQLRAERSGLGNGRVYTIEFLADDGKGGTCTGIATVCTPHSARMACVDNGAAYDSLQ